jgi:hypothetical protein
MHSPNIVVRKGSRSGRPKFKYWLECRISWGFVWFASSLSSKFWDITLKLTTVTSFQFTIQSHSSYSTACEPRIVRTSMKMKAFWDIAPCSLIEVGLDRRFWGAYCLDYQDLPAYGGSTHIWNVDICTSVRLHGAIPQRPSSSYSPPWEPEISP